MAWQDEMGEVLRVMVNDLDSTTFSDDSLERTLVIAALQVSQELAFTQPFRADLNNTDIKPDPTNDNGQTRDYSFINLCCLKAACLISHGSAIVAANRAIAVKDGSSAVDLRGILQGKLKLLDKGYCAVYDDAKMEHQNNFGVAGAAVMTPFRLYAQGYWSHPNTFASERDRDYGF